MLHSFCLHALTSLKFKPDLGTTSVEDCVHVNEHIRLSSLKHRLPMNHTNFPDFLEIVFNVILPKRKQHKQRITNHPTILDQQHRHCR